MSKRFKICLSLWFAVLAISLCCGQTFAQEFIPGVPVAPVPEMEVLPLGETPLPVISDEDWAIEITPALKVRDAAASDVQVTNHEHADAPQKSPELLVSEYKRIYNSIPFDRAEYNRNPTYRHDSAMEILTGNARHTTIVKHQPQQIVRQAAQRPRMNPYQFGYLRPALRLNYYRYFPSLNPYLNAYNLSGAY